MSGTILSAGGVISTIDILSTLTKNIIHEDKDRKPGNYNAVSLDGEVFIVEAV